MQPAFHAMEARLESSEIHVGFFQFTRTNVDMWVGGG